MRILCCVYLVSVQCMPVQSYCMFTQCTLVHNVNMQFCSLPVRTCNLQFVDLLKRATDWVLIFYRREFTDNSIFEEDHMYVFQEHMEFVCTHNTYHSIVCLFHCLDLYVWVSSSTFFSSSNNFKQFCHKIRSHAYKLLYAGESQCSANRRMSSVKQNLNNVLLVRSNLHAFTQMIKYQFWAFLAMRML